MWSLYCSTFLDLRNFAIRYSGIFNLVQYLRYSKLQWATYTYIFPRPILGSWASVLYESQVGNGWEDDFQDGRGQNLKFINIKEELFFFTLPDVNSVCFELGAAQWDQICVFARGAQRLCLWGKCRIWPRRAVTKTKYTYLTELSVNTYYHQEIYVCVDRAVDGTDLAQEPILESAQEYQDDDVF